VLPVKINEVESLEGVTKKNIRFYEEQGLLSPRRNSENGYRDYGEDEVATLRRIRLLRKLGVPINEIRQLQQGGQTVGDCMRRHLVTLERDRKNLDEAIRLCTALQTRQERLEDLDAEQVLAEMAALEQTGTTFQSPADTRRSYAAPVAAALVMVAFMVAALALMVWACYVDPEVAPPPLLLVVLFLAPMLVIVGVLLALRQRIAEIRKGEVEDAKQY
jgi:DNA-binding transcriptional MerR regulator